MNFINNRYDSANNQEPSLERAKCISNIAKGLPLFLRPLLTFYLEEMNEQNDLIIGIFSEVIRQGEDQTLITEAAYYYLRGNICAKETLPKSAFRNNKKVYLAYRCLRVFFLSKNTLTCRDSDVDANRVIDALSRVTSMNIMVRDVPAERIQNTPPRADERTGLLSRVQNMLPRMSFVL